MKKYNVVIDTCVLVSAVISNRGASFKIVSMMPSGAFECHLSVPLVCEYEAVLKRPELALNLTEDEIDEFVNDICHFGRKHAIWYLWRPFLKDAGDEFIAELAVTAQVDAIVTHNTGGLFGNGKI